MLRGSPLEFQLSLHQFPLEEYDQKIFINPGVDLEKSKISVPFDVA